MNSTKNIFAGIACVLLPLALLSFGTLMSTYQTLGNADHVKGALSESGVYGTVVQEGLDQIGQDTAAGNTRATDTIPVEQPEVQAVIKQSMPPELLEEQTNGVIDGVYAWLRGETPTVQFEFDLTDSKVKLADGLGNYVAQRLEALPVCTSAGQISAELNLFTATCVPRGFDKAAAAGQVRDEILNNKDFLEDPVYTAKDLNTNNTQKVQIGNVTLNRDLYNQTRINMYITGALAIVLAAGIVLFSNTRRIGARRVGIITTVIGSISAALAGIFGLILHAVIQRLIQSPDTNAFDKNLIDAVRLLTQDMRTWWLVYGLSLLAAGVITLIVLRVMRPKQIETAPVQVESPAEALKAARPRNREDKLKYPRS